MKRHKNFGPGGTGTIMSDQEYSTFSIKLPTAFIDDIDELRTQWGVETRESVLEKLLEVVFEDSEEDEDDEDLS